MEFKLLYLCPLIATFHFKEKILNFTVKYDSPHPVLDNLRDSPEMWNVELNTIDIYTFKISKKYVPFIVNAHDKVGLNVYIYLNDIKSLCFRSKCFYISAYPIKNPNNVFKTKIYQVEQLITNDLAFHKINLQLLQFILTMVYLYQGIVEIKAESFIFSNYQSKIQEFKAKKRSLLDKFSFDYPILTYTLRRGLVDYIRTFIWYYVDAELMWDESNESKVFIEDLIYEDGLVIRNIPSGLFEGYLTRIQEFLEDEIEDLHPITARLREITTTHTCNLETPKSSCCLMQ